MSAAISYLADTDVNPATDRELRALLQLCFGDVFKDKRYCFEMPPHRWLVRDGATLAAHLAVHEKTLHHEGDAEPFIGVAEVCVAPAYRGRGLVGAMLGAAETFFPHTAFSLLLGNPAVYGSSGYRPVSNVYLPHNDAHTANADVLVKALTGKPWPQGKVVISGPPF